MTRTAFCWSRERIRTVSYTHLINANFEKIYLFQNSTNLEVSEVIQTWVYKRGLIRYDYSMGTTAGLFNGIVDLILVIMANRLSKKYSDYAGIW